MRRFGRALSGGFDLGEVPAAISAWWVDTKRGSGSEREVATCLWVDSGSDSGSGVLSREESGRRL